MEDEHIYYDFLYTNNNDDRKAINIDFVDQRTYPILSNPNDYHLTVLSVECPLFSVPLQVFEDNFYKITMTYGTSTASAFVSFIPNNTSIGTRNIYNYQMFMNNFNFCFQTVFDQIKIMEPLSPPTEAPKLVLDNNTNLFSIIFEDKYDPVYIGVNTISVYINYPIVKVLYSIPYFYQTGLIFSDTYAKLLVYDTGDNHFSNPITSKNYFKMTQSFPSLRNITNIKSIILTTNFIPIQSKYYNSNDLQISNLRRRSLIEIPIPEKGYVPNIQYVPTAQYSYIDLLSNQPLYTIDLQAYWIDETAKLNPINLSWGSSFYVKLLFSKKNSIKKNINYDDDY